MSTQASRENYCRCLYYAANALARNITRMADEAFAVTGLAPSYAFLLMVVNREPGIQPSDIARVMMLTPSTITRLVEKMEARGYLERRTTGKRSHVHPTEQALALDPQIRSAWASLLERYSAVLGEAAAEELTAAVFDASLRLESEGA